MLWRFTASTGTNFRPVFPPGGGLINKTLCTGVKNVQGKLPATSPGKSNAGLFPPRFLVQAMFNRNSFGEERKMVWLAYQAFLDLGWLMDRYNLELGESWISHAFCKHSSWVLHKCQTAMSSRYSCLVAHTKLFLKFSFSTSKPWNLFIRKQIMLKGHEVLPFCILTPILPHWPWVFLQGKQRVSPSSLAARLKLCLGNESRLFYTGWRLWTLSTLLCILIWCPCSLGSLMVFLNKHYFLIV